MTKKRLFYIVFFTLLLILFYVLVIYRNDNWKNTPVVIINKVKPFRFVNQFGDTITEQNVLGKVSVVEFFFTTCEGICPKMNKAMYELYQAYQNNNQFQILSHTVMPEVDSVPVLYAYAQQFKTKPHQWHFLTGNKLDLYYHARHSYSLDDPNNNVGHIKDQFIHTQFFALVNAKGHVIGIYDSLLPSEMNKLNNDIRKLLYN